LCEQPKQKRPLLIEDVRKIAAACNTGAPRDVRDRAIIVIGFASALRRSNLAGLDIADIEIETRGIILQIRREKQDRKSEGRLIGLPRGTVHDTCPVRCLTEWLGARGRANGPLFTNVINGRRLGPKAIGEIVKRRAYQIGLDGRCYGGHSLRSGLVTEAAERGISDHIIAMQTGHRNMDTLRTYFRRTDLWRANAAAMIGL
jgi:integrase